MPAEAQQDCHIVTTRLLHGCRCLSTPDIVGTDGRLSGAAVETRDLSGVHVNGSHPFTVIYTESAGPTPVRVRLSPGHCPPSGFSALWWLWSGFEVAIGCLPLGYQVA